MIPIDLSQKTAIVTGASQGLGEASVRMLHEAGANVVVNYFDWGPNKAKAERIAQELGARATALSADVREPEQLSAMFDEAVQAFGPVDIVVNNAGIVLDRTIKNMTSEEWGQVIDTNLTGVFNVCKIAANEVGDDGRIVNVSSVSGVLGLFGQGNYAAAKAGVVGLTKVLAKELARRRITVNAVAPGVVLTEMGQTIPEGVRSQMLANIPLGRFGDAHEIASVILFLCSDLASYVTGQTLHANGGWFG